MRIVQGERAQAVMAPAAPPPTPTSAVVAPARWARLGEAVRRIAMQKGSRQLSRMLTQVVPGLVDADRATCLLHDVERGMLGHEADDPTRDYQGDARLGLAGAAARAGAPEVCARVDEEPRFAAPVDDPQAVGGERLYAQPIVGGHGGTLAVLVIVRGARSAPFDAADAVLLAALAARCAPLFEALRWEAEAEAEARAGTRPSIYRAEALAAYSQRATHGDVVRVYSPWVRACYRLVVAACLVAVGYLCLAHIDEFSSGAAVVVADGRTDVTATAAGVVDEVLVSPGERVAAGQVVARLRDETAQAELATLEAQFEQQVVERLLAPKDKQIEQTLSGLMAQRQRAVQAVERNALRAPVAGTAGDDLLAPGAQVSYGEPVLSILTDDTSMSLVAMLPAGARPLLHAGMAARVELADHPGVYEDLRVSEVSTDAFGPAAARRKLGGLLGDALPVTGSVVFVRLALPATGFEIDGHRYRFHHGMQARIDVRLRSQRLITALIPGLEEIFHRDYE